MILKGPRTFFFVIIVVVSFFVGLGITICFGLFSKIKQKPFQTAAHLWAKFILFFSGVKVETNGLSNLPRGSAAVLVCNHQSYADFMLLLASLPINFRFAMKKELFKIPVFGWYTKKAGYLSVDREGFRAAYRTLQNMVEIIKNGESVLIFPEGTRSWDGTLGKFKRGSLMAALKSGAPIIPIAISGSYNVLPRGSKVINPSKVKLSVGQPIYIKTEEEYEVKVEEVRNAIAKML